MLINSMAGMFWQISTSKNEEITGLLFPPR